MKVLFIAPHTDHINIPTLPFGLVCVATATRNAGHNIKLLDLINQKDPKVPIKKVVREFLPDIIGISVRNIDDQTMENTKFLLDEVKTVVASCRQCNDVPIVLGGAGYSIFSQSVFEYLGADIGIIGEGESAFPALLEDIKHEKDITGSHDIYIPEYRSENSAQYASDLDALSFPDADLWDLSGYDKEEIWVPFQAKRGCPMGCNYCSTASVEGKTLRMHSAEAVVQAIALHVKAGFRKFYFTDNIFNIPPSFAMEICQAIIDHKLDVSWMCILYPSKIDEDLVKVMAKAGCTEVSLGFESGSDRILNNIHKKFTVKEVRRNSMLLKDYGIRQMGFLLLGGPGETKESVEESLSFADSLPLDALRITVGVRIYPNTELAKTAVNEGLIPPNDNLLHPRFYLDRGLEDWLYDTVRRWMEKRPHWMM